MNALKQIEVIKNFIVAQLQPAQIILFGSYARGNYTQKSDLDMIIVMPSGTKKRAGIYTELYKNAPLFKGGRDFIVTTEDDYNFWKQALNHLFYTSNKEGKVIYDQKIHHN